MTCGTHEDRRHRKAAGYVRNSHISQVGNAREDVQRETVERLARQHGFEHFELYADLGISGEETTNRPEYTRMCRDIEKGLIGAVFVIELSRLTRDKDFLDGFMLYSLCRVANTVLVTPDKVYDPNNPADHLLLAVGLWGGMMEKQLIVTRTAQGIWKTAEQGKLWNGHTPLGYDREPMPGTSSNKPKTWLVKNEVEARLVETVYATVERMGVRKAAHWLNAHGHRYPVKSIRKQITLGARHNNGVPMSDRPWYTSDVLRVIHNRLYSGWYVYGGRRRDSDQYKSVTQPIELRMARLQIISELRWQTIQNLLASRNREVSPPRSTTSPYLFSGILKCATCGGPMKGARTRTSDPSKRQRIYRCTKHAEAAVCPGTTIREVIIRKAIRRDLTKVISAMGLDRVLDQAVHDTLGLDRSNAVLASLDAEVSRLDEAKVKALNLHYARNLSESEVSAELERIATLRKTALRKKEAERSRQRHRVSADELREFMGNDLTVWVRDLQGSRLSRVAKLVYRAFRVAAEGASHKRHGRLTEVEYREDVVALLPKFRAAGFKMKTRQAGIASFGTASGH